MSPPGPLWTISDKNHFLPQMDKVRFGGGAAEQKIKFCLKWYKGAQMVPKGSQLVKNTCDDYFGPFWTLLDNLGTCPKYQKRSKVEQIYCYFFFGTPCILFVVEAANELLCKMLGDSSGVDLDVCIPLMDCYDY